MSLAMFRKAMWIMIATTSVLLIISWSREQLLGIFPWLVPTPKQGSRCSAGLSRWFHTKARRSLTRSYAGEGWLMFIDFTSCPDICPTTLAKHPGSTRSAPRRTTSAVSS